MRSFCLCARRGRRQLLTTLSSKGMSKTMPASAMSKTMHAAASMPKTMSSKTLQALLPTSVF
ncbi:MAG: hypothetical protein KGR16_01895 [Verrucomicrobia bacterium]|nr:hypothetical protein [Verrucomicrobiota bacterium]MDE3047616.1 hypothetical protein [Verrucomicrobiota bacterium]